MCVFGVPRPEHAGRACRAGGDAIWCGIGWQRRWRYERAEQVYVS
jgi:hypothetical protein